MNGHPIAKEEIEQFKQLYQKGESTRSIASKLNKSHSIIIYHLNKLNIKRRSRKEAAKLGVQSGRIRIFENQIPNSSKKLSLEKAYILGVLCGDGFLIYNSNKSVYQIGLSAVDKEFVNEFRNSLSQVYRLNPTKEIHIPKISNWNNQSRTRLCSIKACENLLCYGKFGVKKWRVPERIKRADLEIQSQFIKGFFDSEGNVDEVGKRIRAFSINNNGLEDVKALLNGFGIESKIHSKKNKKPRLPSYTLSVQDRKSIELFDKYINFTIIRKKDRLKQIVSSYKLWVKPHREVIKLKDKMMELRNQGLSYEKIGKELNINKTTVWNHLNSRDRLVP
ncbi:hypothetical protein HYX17_03125 [Candidatus Woesearchaeota archaeon]|nr:hypothetical protein [Candidatus Woesearchaeota archaeon]